MEVESGRWEFQYLALGSIIVMVKKGSLVRTVKWSCDEGANWRTSDLEEPGGPTRIYIIGMKTELGERPRLVTSVTAGDTDWCVKLIVVLFLQVVCIGLL